MKNLTTALLLIAALILPSTHAYATHETNYNNYNYYNDSDCNDIPDPLEKLNRKIFIFNSILDHFILRPVARGYKAILSDYSQDRISSFINNISTPLTTVNNILQGDINGMLASFWKFAINSTLGVGGMYDVASQVGIKVTPQTFGSTLAYYGVRSGPYLVLPIFGSTSARDALDKPFMNSALNPLEYMIHSDFAIGLRVVGTVEKRASIMQFTDYISKNSVDPYAAIRSATYQHRNTEVRSNPNAKCNKSVQGK
jgi:phospholipid-binding lipoprotein MlaA